MYKPSETDIRWATNVIRYLKDGGIIGYPSTRLIYRINKMEKELVLQNPSILADLDSRECHERTVIVFGVLGYRVKEVPIVDTDDTTNTNDSGLDSSDNN